MTKVPIGFLAAALLVLALLPAVAVADPQSVGGDFRISNVGTDENPARGASESAIAYNSQADEYLVVWPGDGLATDDEVEIFGQRLSATGAELGGDFRISNVGTDDDPERGASRPAVTYNSAANEYLVVWQGDGLATDDEFEIFGQRLSATGAELGVDDFRISNVGPDDDPERSAFDPALAYNSAANEYLVTWEGDGLSANDEFEIFGQRLSATGAELGVDDFRISNVGTDDDPARGAFDPAVTYNSAADEYLVTWEGDGLPTDNEVEIFGQRLSATGAELDGDFRISNVGTDDDPLRVASRPAVTYNSAADEYLVTWEGDGLMTDNEVEIFGQRLANQDATTTALECSPKALGLNNASTCTATVTDTVTANNPTGDVAFASDKEGPGAFSAPSCHLGAKPASNNESTCEVDYTPSDPTKLGKHKITATYNPQDTDFTTSSREDEIDVTITGPPHPTAAGLACAPGSVLVGDSVTCTATITDTAPAATVPSGQVKFESDSPGAFSSAAACTLTGAGADSSSCQVTYRPTALGSGSHRLSASYGGDATHLPGLAGASQVTVGQVTVGVAPETTLAKRPRKKTARRRATFTFTADQPSSTFQCKLDKKPFEPCRSPLKIKKLKNGRHTFRVKAINPQGVADPSPAVFRWKVGR